MTKRIFGVLDALAIIVLFVAYLKGVKYAHGLLVLLNLINIPIMFKFNKVNSSEDNNMNIREVFFNLNVFALILLFGIFGAGIRNIPTLVFILISINVMMFFCYSILNKRNISN